MSAEKVVPQVPRKVLIVEPDITDSETIAAILSGAGYDLQVANTYEDGMSKLKSFEPDVVITEVRFGETFLGYNICRESRRLLPSTSILILTTMSRMHDAGQSFSVGADMYLCKPTQQDRLLEIVNIVILSQAEAAHD